MERFYLKSDYLNLYIILEKENDVLENIYFSSKINLREFKEKSKGKIILKIKNYLDGEKVDFQDLKIDLSGYTDFEKKVLEEVKEIPYGKTITYSELANRLGRPKLRRAVGQVLGKNRYPLVIPCHRVIGKNNLGGYKYGIRIKKKLLELEKR